MIVLVLLERLFVNLDEGLREVSHRWLLWIRIKPTKIQPFHRVRERSKLIRVIAAGAVRVALAIAELYDRHDLEIGD